MVRFQVALDQEEADKLLKWATEEMRDPREQIRIILRRELIRHGFLSIDKKTDSEELSGDYET